MRRLTGLAVVVVIGLLTVWVVSKNVKIHRGRVLDPRAGPVRQVYLDCGDTLQIFLDGEYADDLPHYWRGTCTRSARTQFAFLSILGLLAIGFGIAGLRGRPGPRNVPIDSVLEPLPAPEDLRIWQYRPGTARR